ncbi:MAG: hypothetical protein ACO1OQ_00105, partial [Rufibacter sp.]
MKPKIYFLFLGLLFWNVGFGQAKKTVKEMYTEDFTYFWKTISEDYAYLDQKQTDWEMARQLYLSQLDTVTDNWKFTALLERAFTEIYDHHASLNTNIDQSPRLVPSGADIWAEYVNGKPVILEVRRGFGAEKVGLRAGMELVAFNGQPIQEAIKP